MILDTSFFLDLIDGDQGATAMAAALEDAGVPQRVPVQVVYELYVGVGYTERTEEEVRTLEAVLSGRPTVETTARIAKKAGRIDGRLRRQGERVAVNDIVVGATAAVHDEPVVTRNVEDFERIPGVELAEY